MSAIARKRPLSAAEMNRQKRITFKSHHDRNPGGWLQYDFMGKYPGKMRHMTLSEMDGDPT